MPVSVPFRVKHLLGKTEGAREAGDVVNDLIRKREWDQVWETVKTIIEFERDLDTQGVKSFWSYVELSLAHCDVEEAADVLMMVVQHPGEAAARHVSTRKLEDLAAWVGKHPGLREDVQMRIAQEMVLRGWDGRRHRAAIELRARRLAEKDIVAFPPLYRLATESAVVLPYYGPTGGMSNGVTLIQDPTTLKPAAVASEEIDTATDDLHRVVASWQDDSNGCYESTIRRAKVDLDAAGVAGVLAAAGLGALEGGIAEAAEIPATAAFNLLLCAASFGGAYSSGPGAAEGRAIAWRAIADYVGMEPSPVEEIDAEAAKGTWFEIRTGQGWFSRVAWDLSLAFLRPDRRTVVYFAATDTD